MEHQNLIMSQLVFKFPFKTKYFEQDFYVSSNNFSAYKLIESWPNWPGKWLNVFGSKGCGKTHLSKFLKKKLENKNFRRKNISDSILNEMSRIDCLIIENFKKEIEEKLLYSILNHSKQLDNYIVINSTPPIKEILLKLKIYNQELIALFLLELIFQLMTY